MQEKLKRALEGCYVTVPTPFEDSDGLPVNEAALRSYVRFLLEGGLTAEYATFLAGGAAGDFSTMTFDERLRVASIVVDEVKGRVPVAMGAQTTSTLELVRLAKAAKRLGATFIQSPAHFTSRIQKVILKAIFDPLLKLNQNWVSSSTTPFGQARIFHLV